MEWSDAKRFERRRSNLHRRLRLLRRSVTWHSMTLVQIAPRNSIALSICPSLDRQMYTNPSALPWLRLNSIGIVCALECKELLSLGGIDYRRDYFAGANGARCFFDFGEPRTQFGVLGGEVRARRTPFRNDQALTLYQSKSIFSKFGVYFSECSITRWVFARKTSSTAKINSEVSLSSETDAFDSIRRLQKFC